MASKSERTEKPTPKHKKEMREKGNVARSQELGGWASMLLVTSLLPSLGGLAAARISGFVQDTIQAMGHPSTSNAVSILGQGLSTLVAAALPILLVGCVFAVAIAVAQVGFRITPKALRVQFSRVSPKSGIHKVVSSQGLWTLGKTVLKMTILAVVGYLILSQLIHGVLGSSTLPLETTIAAASSTVVNLMRFIGTLALAIAAGDYYFQRRTYQQELKMTKQEVRDEYRQSEGNPEVRRAQRNKARRLSRMNMMAAVANADVVVTNPTHYAVAIAYDRKKDRAPRVLAKGADFNALEIRERAKSCGVVIVENAPLARTLHASCEVNDVVPAQLYASVARLLAFVYSISPTARVFRDVHTMAS
jgi:flagellar biosynthetic protein FlhB